jgi:carbonic anhydrase
MITALEALGRLKAGNRRFVEGARSFEEAIARISRHEIIADQRPFAVILGCSDSRVPVEIIFDHGLGDLFVIRVAGNIVASSQIGSVEFAAEQFGTRLVVVLGHTGCGAIQATIQELQQRGTTNHSMNIRSIVDRIRPAVAELAMTDLKHNTKALEQRAVRANVRVSANALRHGSDIIEQLIQDDGLMIVGAEYSLETGAVEFFEGVS